MCPSKHLQVPVLVKNEAHKIKKIYLIETKAFLQCICVYIFLYSDLFLVNIRIHSSISILVT